MSGMPALQSVPHVATPRVLRGARVPERVLDAEFFANLLLKERCRVDRSSSGELFLLLAVEAGSDSGLSRSSLLESVAHALLASTRESDVVGWLQPDVSLGVILPGWSVADAATTRRLERRIRKILTAQLGEASLRTVSMRFRVYPGSRAANEDLSPLDERFQEQTESQPFRDAVKRINDIVLSAAVLIALLPVYLVIAFLVKLTSPGPILFRQLRVGYMGRAFTMLKFRTMRAESDLALHRDHVTQFIKGEGRLSEQVMFKLTDDPRVTPIGQFLRRTSLDELPQFWNVLVGDMSLVGPRPPLPYEFEQYKRWHQRRVFEARPGVTGLWQVTGRSRTTFDQMVRLDLRYARTRSFWADLRILLATPGAVISGKGAA